MALLLTKGLHVAVNIHIVDVMLATRLKLAGHLADRNIHRERNGLKQHYSLRKQIW